MIVTLLSDFGTSDSYVAQMKGIVLSRAPGATLVDITHEVPPYDIANGAQVLSEVVSAFPAGTIHIAVVDPGVGGDREPVIVATNESFLVGPNNGLLGLSAGRSYQAFRIDLPPFRLETVSATFEGRDVFAPAAAALARGYAAKEAGPPVILRQVEFPQPQLRPIDITDTTPETADLYGKALRKTLGTTFTTLTTLIEGEVIRVDHFGNLITNLRAEHMSAAQVVEVVGKAGAVEAVVVRTFSDVGPGAALAYLGSGGLMEVGIREGNAALLLGAGRGVKVRIRK